MPGFRLFSHIFFNEMGILGKLWRFKGIGGVEGLNLDFLCFNICCSPSYEDSEMGSHTFQFCSVVILWQLARGRCARFFAESYEDIGKNSSKKHFWNTKILITFKFLILLSFWPSSSQNQYKKSVGNRFLKFSFFGFLDD